tara:strand:+ start:171 stop:365 length:195 start_codon:yes stop_codon:yes gene_type:complete
MTVNEVRHNNRIVPSWFPFIQLAIEELEGTMPNVEPALTILREIQPLIQFCEEHADEDGLLHVT